MYLVCGEALFDFFSEDDASGLASKVNFKAIAGGSPFNVAVGLRRLGVDSALFGGLSTDYLGRRLQQVLQDEGVRPDYLVDFAAPTTLAMVAVGANGSPHYSFRGEGCADRQLSLAHLPALGPEVRGLHIGSFSLVVQPIADTLLALVQRESGKRLITLDPNVRLNPEPNIDLWRERIATLVQLADLIKVSDEDLSLLYPEQDPQRVIEGWLRTSLPDGLPHPWRRRRDGVQPRARLMVGAGLLGEDRRHRWRRRHLPGRADHLADRAAVWIRSKACSNSLASRSTPCSSSPCKRPR